MPQYTPAELHALVFDAPLRTVEIRASAPIVNRHIATLERGFAAPKIPVGDSTVLDHLHWYVAGYVLGRALPIAKVDPPPGDRIRYSMRQVVFEELDWENMMGRRP